MKTSYCKAAGCGEKCMPRWASIVCVALGSIVTSYISMSKLGYVNLSQNFSDYANQEFYLAGAGFIAVVGIALFLSLFERFEHYFTAIVFGVSMPGLVYGLANLGAVQ